MDRVKNIKLKMKNLSDLKKKIIKGNCKIFDKAQSIESIDKALNQYKLILKQLK